jgi:hypothetical protein
VKRLPAALIADLAGEALMRNRLHSLDPKDLFQGLSLAALMAFIAFGMFTVSYFTLYEMLWLPSAWSTHSQLASPNARRLIDAGVTEDVLRSFKACPYPCGLVIAAPDQDATVSVGSVHSVSGFWRGESAVVEFGEPVPGAVRCTTKDLRWGEFVKGAPQTSGVWVSIRVEQLDPRAFHRKLRGTARVEVFYPRYVGTVAGEMGSRFINVSETQSRAFEAYFVTQEEMTSLKKLFPGPKDVDLLGNVIIATFGVIATGMAVVCSLVGVVALIRPWLR